tara:strand:- start:103 stop:438 length:336 start_codon:yes stop_codon:yes gene_type:complete
MKVDFNNKKQLLNENWMRMFGEWSKTLLKLMYGDELKMRADLNEQEEPEILIRGEYAHVKAYAEALGLEKDYILAYSDYGKDHPSTVRVKAQLDGAIAKFQGLTGITWPFK